MSKTDLPPVPPAGRSDKGQDQTVADRSSETRNEADRRQRNLDEQGRQGNIKINTTNQGYQQDR
jgi:hypothetical protein